MIKVMGAVFESLYRHGARRFAVINGHGGNDPAIEKAALEMYRRGLPGDARQLVGHCAQAQSDWPTGHGDAQEAAAVMAFAPELVKSNGSSTTSSRRLPRTSKQLHINTVLFEGAPVKVIREIRDTVNTGGLGGLESKFATREWGVAMMDGVTDWMVRYLEAFRRIDLPKKHWD